MILLALLACSDSFSLRFVSPEAGEVVALGAPVPLTVGVTGAAVGDLSWRFEANGAALEGELSLDTALNEAIWTTSALPAGTQTVTAYGSADEASAYVATTFAVLDNQPPTVTFLSPTEGATLIAGVPFEVRAMVEDPDASAGHAGLTLVWSGAAAGALTAPNTMVEPGEVHFFLDGVSEAGTMGLRATDSWGEAGEATVSFMMGSGDADGDGFADAALGGDDCDDEDANVSPAETERCNGVDDDCSGIADDNPVDGQTLYADDDGDGYGDDGQTTLGCEGADGWADQGGDCDDTNAAVNPGAPEQCETGIDENCNGEIDTDASGAIYQWSDADADGYGRGAATVDCAVIPGYAPQSGDCDDTNPSVNPGADEVCDAANADEDCDDAADDADASATGQTRFYADSDRDGYGESTSTSNRCDATAGWVSNNDDCDDGEALAWTGATEVCDDGADNDCSGGDASCALSGTISLSGADVKLTGGGALGFAGDAVDSAGDGDADGLDDLVVGAWSYGTGGTVYLVDGASLSSGSLSGYTSVTAEASGDELGYAVAGCGDVGTDSRDDVVFSAPGNGSGKGAIYLWAGGKAAGAASTATDEVDGSSTTDALGSALDCGADVDDDGKIDALGGAPGAGVAYLYTASTLTKWGTLTGSADAGSAVAFVHDVDGDGVDDLLVGESQSNKAWLVLGSSALGNVTLSTGADAAYTGEATDDSAGTSLAGFGDVDGDGYDDLGIGAPENDSAATAAGSAYVVMGKATPASASLSAADARLRGIDSSDRAGFTVAAAGDSDADGFADVLVGAYYDEAGGTGAGAAYLLYGSSAFAGLSLSAADATFTGESTRDSASEGLAGAADVNGDGADDVIIGAPSEASAGSAAGAVYVLFGGG
ncbi:hypothetical protein LBMAG42_18210 [Deltaproteobacteria bacterium]|nr:hypothetical protein LBMAG42_18210 [Deltaproteobacteria bacterium]